MMTKRPPKNCMALGLMGCWTPFVMMLRHLGGRSGFCWSVLAWRCGGEEGGCEGRYCCGSGEINMVLLWEQTLLRQWGGIDGAPAGASTAAAVRKFRKRSCGSGHCLGQWGNTGSAPEGSIHYSGSEGNTGSAPAGAVTAAAVEIERELLREQTLLLR